MRDHSLGFTGNFELQAGARPAAGGQRDDCIERPQPAEILRDIGWALAIFLSIGVLAEWAVRLLAM